MSDEFIDPLNDPRFPDRPNTPAMWLLSDIGLQHDGRVVEGGERLPDIIGEVIDFDTLKYFAENRLGTAMQTMGLPERLRPAFIATFFDAFMKGAEYVKRTTPSPAPRPDENRYVLGIRWDEDSTELSDTSPGVWWADFWERNPQDPRLGAGGSTPVATKSEAITIIAAWQGLYPDNRLDLPDLGWFMAAPERPEITEGNEDE